MKILFITNLSNSAHRYNQGFSSTPPVYLQNINGIQNYTDTFINNSFENDKDSRVDNIRRRVSSNIETIWTNKADNAGRYKSELNKAEILNKISHALYDAGKTEKAAVILADSFNKIPRKAVSDNEKARIDKLVYEPQNLILLKDFYRTSVNNKSRLYVMESLKKLNSPYYLPVAEDILEFDKDTALYSDKKTSLTAREFLHSHYNFRLLKEPLSKNEIYKNAAMTVLDKWGLPQDINLLENVKNNNDIQIRSKAKNIESHLRKLSNVSETQTNTTKKQYKNPDLKHMSFDEIVKNLVNNQNIDDSILELKNQKYPDGVFNATKLINNMQDIKDSRAVSEAIKYIGQTGAFVSQREYVKLDDTTKSPYDNDKAEAYCKILLRSKSLSPSFGASNIPSFSATRIWDKKKFDPLNAPDSVLDDLAEKLHFTLGFESSVRDAITERYPEGFLESIFAAENYKNKVNIATKRLYSRIKKVLDKKQKILEESIELNKKKALGISNISKQKVRVNSTFIEPLKLDNKTHDVPVSNGIFIYGKAFDNDKNKFIEWLKNESEAQFVELTYDENNPKSSINQISEQLNIAQNVHQLTGSRTILYLKDIDKLLSDRTNENNIDCINEFKTLVEGVSKNYYTTFLIKTNLPLTEFDDAAKAPHRFDLKLNLSEGITQEDEKRLEELTKELDRLEQKTREGYDLYKYDDSDYDGGTSDYLYRSLLYDTDF